jgi:parallel beta-helix repeat protein
MGFSAPRIGQALAAAVAGDTVLVGPGDHAEEVRTVRPGRPGAPIRIVGRPGAHLVGPRGRGQGRLVQVLHDHVTLQSLELSDANILVWVEGAKGPPAGNDIGLHVRGRARSVVAEANRLTANRLDGLRVSSGATQVTATRNLIDFNQRAGVFIARGSAEIGPANRLLDNEMGVWLSSDARGTAVMDNSIEANVLDGVHLAGSRVGLVRGNTIRANRKAAFSVAFKGSARPFLTENRVAGDPARERVRVDGHPKPTG